MNDIIDYIDEQIAACTPSVTSYGLCHLIDDNGSVHPATFEEDGEKVTPDDENTITIYHRLLAGNYDFREDLSFGRNRTRENAQRIRTVVFIPLSESQSKIDDIINSLPDRIELNGYRSINLSNSVDLIRDSNAIWQDEFPDSFKSKYQKRYQIYAIEYNVEYIKCPECETVSP